MKKLITILSLLTISTSAFASAASDCRVSILQAAQMNLDLKAKQYQIMGIDSGNIDDQSLVMKEEGHQIKATMDAKIHVGLYKVEVTMNTDSRYCSVEQVKIIDLGER